MAPFVEICRLGASAQVDAPAPGAQSTSTRLNIGFNAAETAYAARICEAHGLAAQPAPDQLRAAVQLSLAGVASPTTMALLREYERELKKSAATICELQRKLDVFTGATFAPKTYGASGPVATEYQPLLNEPGPDGSSSGSRGGAGASQPTGSEARPRA